jgi:hypothetical protein
MMMYGKKMSDAEIRAAEMRGGENEVRGSLDAQKALGRTMMKEKPAMPMRGAKRKMKR